MTKLTTHRALALQIATILRKEVIAKYQPGDRIPGDNELAERFKVSYMTVRQAMVSLVHEGVLVRRQGSGTYVAEQTGSLTVAIYTELDIYRQAGGSFAALVVGHLQQILEDAQIPSRMFIGAIPAYNEREPGVQPVADEPTCQGFIEAAKSQRLRGVFQINAPAHESWLKPLRQRKIPVIGADEGISHLIRTDICSGITLAVERLVSEGLRDLALIDWTGKAERPDTARHAFRAAMQAHGLEIAPERMAGDIHPLLPGAGWYQFRAIWQAATRKPQALIIADDYLFRDALYSALELGVKIPDGLRIVSLRNRGSSVCSPLPVLWMENDPELYARAYLDRLLAIEAGDSSKSVDTISCVLQDDPGLPPALTGRGQRGER